MKIRSVVFGVSVLFIGLCAWAQSGSSDYKMQAIQFAQNDFYNHVTVASNCIYLATVGDGPLDSHKIVQYTDITFKYADGTMSEADELNGIAWKERVYVFSSAFREYRDDCGRVWSDWRDGRGDCIFLYEIEIKKNSQFTAKGYGLAFAVGFNTEWEMLKPWRREWGQSGLIPIGQVWARTVRIPSDLIPDGTKNVDLVRLYNSLADSVSPVKAASSSSENGSSGQMPQESTAVKPGFRLKIGGKSVVGGE